MQRFLGLVASALLLTGAQSAPAKKPAPANPTAKPSPSPTPQPVLVGTVKGPDGKPVEGALIVAKAAASEERTPLSTKTDAQGAFKLPLKKPTLLDLRVEMQGLAIRRFEKWPPANPLNVQLAKGSVLEGTVRDGTSGAVVAGARVEARAEGAWDPALTWDPEAGGAHAVTDAKGRYRLEGLGAGVFYVEASARSYGQAERQGVKLGRPLDLFLFPGASISGTVLGPDGKPAPGAIVQAKSTHGWPASTRVADAEGLFDIFGLTAGTYNVIARLPGLAPAVAANVAVGSEGEIREDLALRAGGRVLGRLIATPDKPVAGGRVRLQEASGAVLPDEVQDLLQATADTDGRFHIDAVPPGSVVLVASGHALAPLRVDADVRDGAHTDVGEVLLERGVTIEGHVRDRAGNGIRDATLAAWKSRGMDATHPETRTEADGAYVLPGAEAGSYNITVQAPGFAMARFDAQAGATNADVVLEPGGSITGSVVDDAGSAVQSFEVTVRPKGGQPWDGKETRKEIVNDDGRFIVDDVGEGLLMVEVAASQYASATASDVRVRAGSVTDVGRLRLTSAGAVHGVVVSGDGAGIPGATVHARIASFTDSGRNTTQTDGRGAFELHGLPTGKVDLAVSHPSFADGYAAGVDVDPSKTAPDTRIVLSRGGRIEGTVRKRDGGPVSGASVQVNPVLPEGRFIMWGSGLTPVAPDGSFAVERVPAGHVRITLMAGSAGRYEGQQTVEGDVRDGDTVTVELVSRDILVSGHVTRGASAAPGLKIELHGNNQMTMFFGGPTTEVAAAPTGPQRGTATTAEDGSYSLIVSSAGAYSASVQTPDERSSFGWRSVEIPDADAFTYDVDIGGVPLAGLITDKIGDVPIPKARFSANPKNNDATRSRHGVAGPDGRFEVDVPAGDYTMMAAAEGYASTKSDVTVGDAGADVKLVLARGVVLKGRVLDPAGRPAANCPVSVAAGADLHTAWMDEVITLPDGSFQFQSLHPASYAVLAGSALSGFAFQAAVNPGAEDLSLTLQPASQARIRVRGADGAAVPAATASLSRVNGAFVRAAFAESSGQSDAGGILLLPVPAGAVEFEVRKDKLSGTVTLNVPAGGTASGDVVLKPSE